MEVDFGLLEFITILYYDLPSSYIIPCRLNSPCHKLLDKSAGVYPFPQGFGLPDYFEYSIFRPAV